MEEKKVALVTGGAKGIGRSCCHQLSKKGYHVAIHYRSNREEAERVAEEIGNCSLYHADLSQENDCLNLMKAIKADHGGLDVLVNNAGVTLNKMLAFSKSSDFENIFSTNFRSVFLLAKAAARLMLRKRSGVIVNIGSVVAHTGNAGQALYTASKGALTSFTKSLALELGPAGIRCNTVAPGYIQTNMTEDIPADLKEKALEKIPVGRFGQAEEIGRAVAFLASDDASYVTGTTLHVNGGLFLN